MTKPINSKTFNHGLPEGFRIKRMLDLGALALILGTVAMPVSEVWATDYTISTAVTTLNGGYTLSTGDTLTITATGSVNLTGPMQNGVATTVGGTTITNKGSITTTGADAIGISAGTALLGITGDVTIRGSGNIATSGGSAHGISSRVITGNATITAGNIATTGGFAYGISSSVVTGNATIAAGYVLTTGFVAQGIHSSVTTGNATISAGDISTAGSEASGIYSYVGIGSSTVTAGNITTTGSSAFGLISGVTTGNLTITTGNIATQGDYAVGIASIVGTGNSAITAGNVSTTGSRSYGIWSQLVAGSAAITAGDISNAGVSAHGIWAAMGVSGTSYLSIFNDHKIAVTGVFANAVYMETTNNHATIVNTGTIYSAKSYGIANIGHGLTITNSGTIFGGVAAVLFHGGENTLTLLAGSNVQGLLDIASIGGNTLSIGKRLNTALAYTYVGLTVEANGIPYAYADVGNYRVLAVVDPTLFAAEADMVADLSRSVGNAIDTRLGSVVGQSANTIMASTSNVQATGSQWDTWVTGLASYRQQGEEGLNDGFDTTLGGFTLGSDTVLSSGTRFGGFVGASHAHLTTNAGNEQIDSASTYAGIYAGYTLHNAFVNLGLIAGYANADTSRDVLNNMVAGGIEQAKGNPDGTFLTPQATIGTQIKTSSGILTPSLRVAYTHLAMDSYVETGSLANMTVAARTVSTLDLRGQVAFAIKPIVTATGQIDATMRLGADASFTNSDDISATVLSQPLTFSTTQDTALRGFAGLDLAQAMDNGAKLNLSVEAGYGTNSAVTLQGTAGLVWAF